jgi:hypothetical protein
VEYADANLHKHGFKKPSIRHLVKVLKLHLCEVVKIENYFEGLMYFYELLDLGKETIEDAEMVSRPFVP